MESVSIYEATAAKRKISIEQKSWKYIRELCSLNENDMDRAAVIDGNRKFTYDAMFREWERYAAVFTALDMTEEQQARVGVLGSTCAEVIFAFYGLNRVGAQVSLVASWSAFNAERIKQTILDEKLTDFILTDDLAQQDLVRELLLCRKELGLRHVILMHVHVGGAASNPMLAVAQETKYAFMSAINRPICMETLLASFGSGEVYDPREETDDTAFIIHTTGTTSGAGKPVPLSDIALNAAVERFMRLKDLALPFDHLVSSTMVDLSNSYGIIDQVHLPFAMGATVVTVPLGFLNPWFYRIISTYRVSFFFSVNSMFERWLKLPEDTPFDFSSLKFVALGGTAVSTEEKKRYHAFLEAHGGKNVTILNGYGLSELGGACCLSSPDLDDDSIGYAMPGITVRLRDEETGRCFSPRGKGGEGVLYMTARSMAAPKLDGKEVIKVETIGGKPYVCTNDLVRMDPDGRITYLGRANRFFMREEGKKYESGRVETEFSRMKDLEGCAIVPVYHKVTHDTLPMLCVKTLEGAGDPQEIILRALSRVFIEKKTLPEDCIPSRVQLVEEFPRNANGKIDMAQLNQGKVEGEIFTVEQIREEERLTAFGLTLVESDPGDIVEQVLNSITTDFKNRAQGEDLVQSIKNGTPFADENRIAEDLELIRYMHEQTMNNMFGMVERWFPWNNRFMNFGRTNGRGNKKNGGMV